MLIIIIKLLKIWGTGLVAFWIVSFQTLVVKLLRHKAWFHLDVDGPEGDTITFNLEVRINCIFLPEKNNICIIGALLVVTDTTLVFPTYFLVDCYVSIFELSICICRRGVRIAGSLPSPYF